MDLKTKKMKYILIAVLSLLCFSIKAQEPTIIKAKIKGNKGKYVYLQKSGDKTTLDSAKNHWLFGRAKFNITVDEPYYYQIGASKTNTVPLVLTGGENVCVKANSPRLKTYDVEGSPDSELVQEYFAVKNNPKITKDSLANFAEAFIKKNNSSLALFVALGDVRNQKESFAVAEKGIGKAYPNSAYHELLKKYIKAYEEKNSDKQTGPARMGQVAPELDFPNPDGKVITLESLRGKYVLVDFWASWCGPCRRENPTVVRLYNKYKDKGFDVYSVSLDNNKSRWEAAIEKDGLIWPNHVSDLKQWRSAAVKKYGFGGIPYTVLLDKEGKVIATKLRGAQLENKLRELFGF